MIQMIILMMITDDDDTDDTGDTEIQIILMMMILQILPLPLPLFIINYWESSLWRSAMGILGGGGRNSSTWKCPHVFSVLKLSSMDSRLF